MPNPKDTESVSHETTQDKDSTSLTPDGLRVLNASLEDYAEGRFTEFEF